MRVFCTVYLYFYTFFYSLLEIFCRMNHLKSFLLLLFITRYTICVRLDLIEKATSVKQVYNLL